MTTKEIYDKAFYDAMSDMNYSSADSIVPIALQMVGQISSVIDVGCGRGLWLKAFQEHGVEDVFGVDGTWVKQDDLVIPHDRFESRDFENTFTVGRTADLAISVEVAEHISPARADAFVKALVDTAPVILFSAAIPGQGGTDHRNEQWPAYWIEKFKQHGYVSIDAIRRKVWNDKRVAFFYAQNALIFANGSVLQNYPKLVAEKERETGEPLPLVHPTLFSRIYEDAERWKLVVPYINKLPLSVLRSFKTFLSRGRQ